MAAPASPVEVYPVPIGRNLCADCVSKDSLSTESATYLLFDDPSHVDDFLLLCDKCYLEYDRQQKIPYYSMPRGSPLLGFRSCFHWSRLSKRESRDHCWIGCNPAPSWCQSYWYDLRYFNDSVPASLFPLHDVVIGSRKEVNVDPARIRSDVCENGLGEFFRYYSMVTEPKGSVEPVAGKAESSVAVGQAIQLVRLEAPSIVWKRHLPIGVERKTALVAQARQVVTNTTATIAELQEASVRSAVALEIALDAAAAGNAVGELSDLGALLLEGRRIADEIKRQMTMKVDGEQHLKDLEATPAAVIFSTHTVTPHFYLRIGANQLVSRGGSTSIVHINPVADMLQFKCEDIKKTHSVSE